MNTDQRPTPKTERIMDNVRVAMCADNDDQRINHKEEVMREIEQLERECDEAREELAKIEQKVSIQLGGHTDSKLWGEAGLIAATMRCVDALNEVTEQRDEWKAKFIQQNKDLGCEMMDPNGTIWDHAKKLQAELTAVTEQRDRQAESLDRALNATVLNHRNDRWHIDAEYTLQLNKSLTTKP